MLRHLVAMSAQFGNSPTSDMDWEQFRLRVSHELEALTMQTQTLSEHFNVSSLRLSTLETRCNKFDKHLDKMEACQQRQSELERAQESFKAEMNRLRTDFDDRLRESHLASQEKLRTLQAIGRSPSDDVTSLGGRSPTGSQGCLEPAPSSPALSLAASAASTATTQASLPDAAIRKMAEMANARARAPMKPALRGPSPPQGSRQSSQEIRAAATASSRARGLSRESKTLPIRRAAAQAMAPAQSPRGPRPAR